MPASQPKRNNMLALILGALVVFAVGGGSAVYLLRDTRTAVVDAPVEPVKPAEPVKPVEPVKPEEPEQPVKPAEPVVAAPKEPVPLGRVEAKKPLKVFRDKDEFWVKLDKPKKVSVGDTYKIVGPPLADGKKNEREWYAEGTVMEKKGTIARLSMEPSDAPLPKDSFAVPAEKERDLRKKFATATGTALPAEPKKDEPKKDEPVAKKDEPKKEDGKTAEAPKTDETKKDEPAKTDEAKAERKVLKGKLLDAAWGRVELTNNDTYTWTGCRVWREPNLLYTFPPTWKLGPGEHDTVQVKEFQEQDKTPDGWKKDYPLVICKEGSGHMALR
jgi:hypothetical protein